MKVNLSSVDDAPVRDAPLTFAPVVFELAPGCMYHLKTIWSTLMGAQI